MILYGMSKRNCIFTGKPSDFKITFQSTQDDLHSWIKGIPTTKEYVSDNNLLHRVLNKREMKLVELFYEQELAKLKASNIAGQMAEIRLEDEGEPLRPKSLTRDDYDMTDEEYEEEFGLGPPPLTKEENDLFEELQKLEEEDGIIDCPKCNTKMVNVSDGNTAVGPFCPKVDCPVGDGYLLYIDEPDKINLTPEELYKELIPTKVLTEEEKDVKVEKVATKKKGGMWN